MSATEAYFVTRTMRAMELLAFGPASVRELAAALQVHERTARRILSRLLDEDYVTRLDEPRRRYVLTMRVAALASQAVRHSRLVGVGAPAVALLHAETALTAQLLSPSYDSVLCVAQHADGAGGGAAGLGELMPAHCTAGGKVLLGGRPHWRASLLARLLPAYTARTITDPAVLEEQAAAARARGYASEDGEYREQVRAVAAPVRDHAGEVVAAVAVSGDRSLDVDALSGTVVHAASAISVALPRRR